MGIPSYFSHIIKNHANIIQSLHYHRNIAKTKFHSLYMDCNSIVYDAVRRLEQDQDVAVRNADIIREVIVVIRSLVGLIAPSNILYIAFDGVAPFAKMDQQRTRRFKTGFLSALDFTEEGSPVLRPPKSAGKKWNTSAITPGTPFMAELAAELNRAFSLDRSGEYGVQTLVVSTGEEAGEGEHKMFEYMRKNAKVSETIAVYGLDADLIMLSLFHCFACSNIYLFREAPEFSKTVVSVASQDAKEPLFVNHRELAKSILVEMGCFTGSSKTVEEDRGRIYDYIFMCFLLGNDFLPHFPALNIRTHAIYTLLELYKAHIAKRGGQFISVETGDIQWRWVKSFLGELAVSEHRLFLDEYKARDKLAKRHWSDKSKEDRATKFDNLPIWSRGQEEYICPEETGWQSRYYKTLFHKPMEESEIREVSIRYLEGLEWVFKYYTEGCPCWKWKYGYHYPPLLQDLVKYVPEFKTEFISENTSKPFHPEVQLAYVIPPWQHTLLSPAMREIIRTEPPEYFTAMDNLRFEWAFCRYFWESHAMLEDIPLAKLEQWNRDILAQDAK